LACNCRFAVFHTGRDLSEQNITLDKGSISTFYIPKPSNFWLSDASSIRINGRHWQKGDSQVI
jgi:hypothetical protein